MDIIADQAIQNGSGSRAAQSALALGSPATTFAESSLAWYLSCDQEQRSGARRYGSWPQNKAPQVTLEDALMAFQAATLIGFSRLSATW